MLHIYNNNSDKRVLSKNITLIQTFDNVQPYREINIINPNFICDYNNNVVKSNYCYYSNFDRYYFIDNITILDNNKCIIHCSIDVLMSYQSDIKNLNVLILRNENIQDTKLHDTNMPISCKRQIIGKNFGKKLQYDNTYVLGVI